MKTYNINGLEVTIGTQKHNNNKTVTCSNGYYRTFVDYTNKEILAIIKAIDFDLELSDIRMQKGFNTVNKRFYLENYTPLPIFGQKHSLLPDVDENVDKEIDAYFHKRRIKQIL